MNKTIGNIQEDMDIKTTVVDDVTKTEIAELCLQFVMINVHWGLIVSWINRGNFVFLFL